jgi:hypothetical protein
VLAGRRSLRLNGVEIERTPLLVPSFSSKGFPEIKEIVGYSSELIEGPILVSAYDLHYGCIEGPFDFASLIFLDSGGYEASKMRISPILGIVCTYRKAGPAKSMRLSCKIGSLRLPPC